jgi:hypothetical protein
MSGVGWGAALAAATFFALSALLKLLPLYVGGPQAPVRDRLSIWGASRFIERLLTPVAIVELVVVVGVLAQVDAAAVAGACLGVGFAGIGLAAVVRGNKMPCGCLGAASQAHSTRSIARSLLLAAAFGSALVGSSSGGAGAVSAGLLVAIALLALSPELRRLPHLRWGRQHALVFRGDCATTQVPLELSIHDLRASSLWASVVHDLRSTNPVDTWREGCWRFLEVPTADEEYAAVFAMKLDPEVPDLRYTKVRIADGEAIDRREGRYVPSHVSVLASTPSDVSVELTHPGGHRAHATG